jgi:hypothetical protein
VPYLISVNQETVNQVRVHVVNALGYQVHRSVETIPGRYKSPQDAASSYAGRHASVHRGGKVYVHNAFYTETLATSAIS